MDCRSLLRCRQFRHAVKERFDRLCHPLRHHLPGDGIGFGLLTVHRQDERLVAPCIAVTIPEQWIELRIRLFQVTADTQRNCISLHQRLVLTILQGQFIILLGLGIATYQVERQATIGRDLPLRNAILHRLVEITDCAKGIFLGEQCPPEAGFHPAAIRVDFIGLGQETDGRPRVAERQRGQSSVRQRR